MQTYRCALIKLHEKREESKEKWYANTHTYIYTCLLNISAMKYQTSHKKY